MQLEVDLLARTDRCALLLDRMQAKHFTLIGEIAAEMSPPRLFAPKCGSGDKEGERDKVARRSAQVRSLDLFEFRYRALQRSFIAQDADPFPHHPFHTL